MKTGELVFLLAAAGAAVAAFYFFRPKAARPAPAAVRTAQVATSPPGGPRRAQTSIGRAASSVAQAVDSIAGLF